MKITPINYSYANNNIHQKSQSFEGLWGKTSRTTDYDRTLCIPTVTETYYYYPFVDESPEEIRQVVKDNTMADIEDSYGSSKYMIKDCKICTTLPFKKVNFDTYALMDASTRMTKNAKIVHYCAKDKFITNAYGEQTSASNESVAQKLLDAKV